MPTYTGVNIKDLSVSTPTEGATPPSEVNDSIREIKTVFKNQNAVASKTADYTLTNADSVIYVSASGGNVILTLPQQSSVSSSTFIKEYIIVRTDTSSNTVTIDPYSTETINGAATFAIPVLGASTYPSTIHLIGNGGTDWKGIRIERPADVINSVQAFTSSGTWTKPSGVTKVRVQLVAGGGGGGFSGTEGAPGGAAGGYSEEIIDVSAVSSVSVTIGAGGAGSSATAVVGGTGGTTSFGAYLSATGGTGGAGHGTGLWVAGDGGSGSGGDINIAGGDGETRSGTEPSAGSGGASYFGGGGKGGSRGQAQQYGSAGRAYGSGGGGGSNSGEAGGNGKAGICIVYEY